LDPTSITAYLEEAFYADTDVKHSFHTALGQQVDCIDFYAQHSFKALQAQGVSIPSSAPSLPSSPVTPAYKPDAFRGDLDADGNARICPTGTVPSTRPTLAQITAVGGIAVFKGLLAQQKPPSGSQDPAEHDCWLNSSNGDRTSGPSNWQYEHAVGIQSPTSGAYGFVTNMAVYNGTVVPGLSPAEHNDSQLWVQTGSCDNLYPGNGGSPQCTIGAGGNAIQSLEAGWIVAPDYPPPYFGGSGHGVQTPYLFVFFTADGYNTDFCWAGQGGSCCPGGTSGGLTQGTDCWVAWPGATYVANEALTPGTIGVTPPPELVIQVWQGSATNSSESGWWVWANGNLIGWYPPNTFTYPNSSVVGPMGYGPATYLQAGGEVFDAWQSGGHTSTSMGSGIAPSVSGSVPNYGQAAYHRNITYIDNHNNYISAGLSYYWAPAYEQDYGYGVCGYQSGWWENGDGTGSYSLSLAGAPNGQNWGEYFFYGGGEGQCVGGASPPCVPP
jgi:Neprosin